MLKESSVEYNIIHLYSALSLGGSKEPGSIYLPFHKIHSVKACKKDL